MKTVARRCCAGLALAALARLALARLGGAVEKSWRDGTLARSS
jgi:hypothetical protein